MSSVKSVVGYKRKIELGLNYPLKKGLEKTYKWIDEQVAKSRKIESGI